MKIFYFYCKVNIYIFSSYLFMFTFSHVSSYSGAVLGLISSDVSIYLIDHSIGVIHEGRRGGGRDNSTHKEENSKEECSAAFHDYNAMKEKSSGTKTRFEGGVVVLLGMKNITIRPTYKTSLSYY
jgi:hypothetical protein